MVKERNRIVSILLSICVIFSCIPVVSYASSDSDAKYKRAMSSYSNFLEKMEKGGSDGEWYFTAEEYALHDFNKDGIPELITHGGGQMDYSKIYTCNDGFIQNVHSGSTFQIYSNGIVEYSFNSGSGYWTDSFYKMDDELNLEYVYAYTEWLYDDPETFSEGEYSYEEDSEKVDYAVIQEHKASVLEGASLVQLDFSDNTVENRTKQFGAYTTAYKEYREYLGGSDSYNYIRVKDNFDDGFLVELFFLRLTGTDGYVYAYYIDSNEAAFYDESSDLAGTLSFEGNKLILDLDEVEDFYLDDDLSEFVNGLHHEFTLYSRNNTLDNLMEKSSYDYNNALALKAAEMCMATYAGETLDDYSAIESYLAKLGFTYIASKNYGDEEGKAFTVAKKEYIGKDTDNNTGLVVIVAQGTTNQYEQVKDATALDSKSFAGQCVYDIVGDFYNEIAEEVSKILVPGNNYKVLITGHSLGGAAANLVGAGIQGIKKKNVFCYTFAALNSISSSKPVSAGYENIHNIYNTKDTFSPSQYGNKVLISGMGTGVGKFGHMDYYTKEHRTADEMNLNLVDQIILSENHKMSNIVEDVRSGLVKKALDRDGVHAIKVNVPKTLITKLTKGKKSFIVKWKKLSGVTGYQVQYGLKKTFKGAKTVTVYGYKTTSKKIKKLKSKKKYYVRVRAYKTVYGKTHYSPWSTVKSTKTK